LAKKKRNKEVNNKGAKEKRRKGTRQKRPLFTSIQVLYLEFMQTAALLFL
jgi:hypothetical protein